MEIPACAIHLLARPEWYSDLAVFQRARLKPAGWFTSFISSERFSGGAVAAITLGRTIYLRTPDAYDPHSLAGLALLAHELKHVEQYEQIGFFRFYYRYLRGYLSRGYGEDIPIEAEAYAFERVVLEHLRHEFDANGSRKMCVEMAPPHTPNLAFEKIKPEAFHFSE
jgi:hypothetical protein